MREKKIQHGSRGHDEKSMGKKGRQLPDNPSSEPGVEYSNILVNLFGIEFYTPETPIKQVKLTAPLTK